jgi:LacI family transcriptional regulator
MPNPSPSRKKSGPRFVDIAALANVGIATVNRVLNDRGGVSMETRDKVIQAARQLAVPRVMPDLRRGLTRFDVVLVRSRTPFFQRLNLALQRFMQLLDSRIVVHRHEFASEDDVLTSSFIRNPPHRREGLILAVHDTPALRDAIQYVSHQGIPVVTLMSNISDVSGLHYTGINNLHAGRTAGHFMGQLVKTKGLLLVLTNDLIYRAHRDRSSGFLSAIQERFSHLECSEVMACRDDPDQTYAAVDRALKHSGAQVVGIYHSGAGSLGICKALQRHGRQSDVVWIGHELTDEHRSWLMQGTMNLVIDQDPDGQVLSGMQHLLFMSKWLEQPPPGNANEFRLFCAENLPLQPYLPGI